jgi:DNA-repair protein complementing XP-A cells
MKHYKVNVCKNCKGTNERYAQISKTEAKVDYLLTESELNDSEKLPFWDKPNPKRSQYARMYLYLRFQLEAFAVEKWGSLEALDAEVQRRVDGTKQRQEAKFKNNLKKLRERTRTSTWRKEVKEHEHQYGPSWVSDGMTNKECTVCGSVISYEEF